MIRYKDFEVEEMAMLGRMISTFTFKRFFPEFSSEFLSIDTNHVWYDSTLGAVVMRVPRKNIMVGCGLRGDVFGYYDSNDGERFFKHNLPNDSEKYAEIREEFEVIQLM